MDTYRERQGQRDRGTGKKEIFYLTTHSTHFILRLYGVGHMVNDHSDSERGNPLPSHGLLFPISSKGSFICIRQDSTYHGLCGALAGTISSSWVHQRDRETEKQSWRNKE